jgi:NTP pyrophosphatase (non-canonical NTP hydrolase)
MTSEFDSFNVGPLRVLAREIIEINTENGWNVLRPSEWMDTYKVPAILALIHSEVSEALEEFRVGDMDRFATELADVLIRVLDCSEGLGIDIDAVVAAKLEKNRGRTYRHGGKRV